jgi:hypothetical protein
MDQDRCRDVINSRQNAGSQLASLLSANRWAGSVVRRRRSPNLISLTSVKLEQICDHHYGL